jgi:hypothetical protein
VGDSIKPSYAKEGKRMYTFGNGCWNCGSQWCANRGTGPYDSIYECTGWTPMPTPVTYSNSTEWKLFKPTQEQRLKARIRRQKQHIEQLEKALARMQFAYVNKDADCPHDF